MLRAKFFPRPLQVLVCLLYSPALPPSRLDEHVSPPTVVREMDWIERHWPDKLPEDRWVGLLAALEYVGGAASYLGAYGVGLLAALKQAGGRGCSLPWHWWVGLLDSCLLCTISYL